MSPTHFIPLDKKQNRFCEVTVTLNTKFVPLIFEPKLMFVLDVTKFPVLEIWT